MDQACVFDENLSRDQKISKKKSVDQTCDGMHMQTRDGGDSGPNLGPPYTYHLIRYYKEIHMALMISHFSQALLL